MSRLKLTYCDTVLQPNEDLEFILFNQGIKHSTSGERFIITLQ